MSIEQMRAAVAAAYSGPNWARRVGAMPDHQVIAVYNKFKEEGKLK